jgi:hypothetical protein
VGGCEKRVVIFILYSSRLERCTCGQIRPDCNPRVTPKKAFGEFCFGKNDF